MNLKTLEKNLSSNVKHLRSDLVSDLKAEVAHATDPSQCGVVVKRHFDGIVFALYALILLFLGASAFAIYLYVRLHRG